MCVVCSRHSVVFTDCGVLCALASRKLGLPHVVQCAVAWSQPGCISAVSLRFRVCEVGTCW